ncbi:glycosyltransferase family 2 protein [Paraconexibacter sp.]|uniref:glycosyltransferase family 2 protein n=1 Tax=Paraconexibacter sp. TaxID=2949640 RepID=UPI00356B3D8D
MTSAAPRPPVISIVAPAFNEEDGLREFCTRMAQAVADEDYELIIVDDGSTDRTPEVLAEIVAADPRVRAARLSRNFGHQAALTAGLTLARGEAVISIDADLQDPPEVARELIARWRAGADVVHAVRHVRPGEPRMRLLAIRVFYRAFGRISGLENYPGNAGDFRLISRRALDAVVALPERNRFVRGLVSWVGYRQESVEYERDERFAGVSKYPLSKLAQLAADGVISFSTLPLRISSLVGIACSIAAFVAIPVVVGLRLAGLYEVTGVASIHILVLGLGGLQLTSLGIVGEYLARAYDESKARPTFIIESVTEARPDGA